MFRQVQQAIVPRLPMACAISNWPNITEGLATSWRQRRMQVDTIMGQHPMAATRIYSGKLN